MLPAAISGLFNFEIAYGFISLVSGLILNRLMTS